MTRQPIDTATFREMAAAVGPHDRDEMAIPSYTHPNPLARRMAWRRVEVVARWLKALCPAGGTVLDFGCGTGVLFEAALSVAGEVIGVDRVLEAARLWVGGRGAARVRLLSPEAAAGLPPASIDVVLAAESLEHLAHVAPTLNLFHRVLKPSGSLLVTLPTENAAYRLGRRLAGFESGHHHGDARSIEAEILGRFALARGGWIPAPRPFALYRIASFNPR